MAQCVVPAHMSVTQCVAQAHVSVTQCVEFVSV